MTTVVRTSEEDPAIAVDRFTAELSRADAGAEVAERQVSRLCLEAQEYMVQNRWLDLTSLMLTSADVISSKAYEKDLECVYTVICNLVKKPESVDQLHEVAERIATKVIQHPNDKPVLWLKIAQIACSLSIIRPSTWQLVERSLNMLYHSEWNLGMKDYRLLFLAANLLKEYKSSGKDAFNFLLKYLATFSGEDALAETEVKEEAVKTIVEFIKAPDIFQCDLLDMLAVAQLEKDAKHVLVYEFLEIFRLRGWTHIWISILQILHY